MSMAYFVSIFTALFASNSWANECSFQNIKSQCSKIETRIGPLRLSDGSRFGDIESINSPRGKKLSKDERRRLEAIFADSKNYTLKTILRGKDPDSPLLSHQEKHIVKRVRSILLDDMKSKESRELCKARSYYGYSPRTNKFWICPELANYPAPSLVMAMSTFVSRGAGYCMTSYPASATDPAFENYKFHPLSLESGGLHQCLLKSDQIHLGAASSQDVLDQLKTNKDSKAYFDSIKVHFVDEKSALTEISQRPFCYPAVNNGQLDSANSFWVGSNTMALYSKDKNLNYEGDQQLASMALLIDEACRWDQKLSKEIEVNAGHPAMSARFDDIIFKNPQVRDLFGCSKPVDRVCDFHRPESIEPAAKEQKATAEQ